MDIAVVGLGPASRSRPMGQGSGANRDLSREGPGVGHHVHLGAMDAPALPLRSIDGFRLAANPAPGIGEYCCDGRFFVGQKLMSREIFILDQMRSRCAVSLTPCFSKVSADA